MSNIMNTSAGNIFAPGLKARQHNQTGRIQAGAADGSLSTEERAQVASQRATARANLVASKADDGVVGYRERQAAHQELNGISQSIFGFRHN